MSVMRFMLMNFMPLMPMSLKLLYSPGLMYIILPLYWGCSALKPDCNRSGIDPVSSAHWSLHQSEYGCLVSLDARPPLGRTCKVKLWEVMMLVRSYTMKQPLSTLQD
ncbi:hypothetical protein EYF80_047111 [Liparis tanakae]|uniref:Uncharacterized protein n=1 Tax=Liparis tanakae TaxID=230148 RepID=A0A4Z2FNR6_9TELE|nr:hypothetical protein EYF80_047111 [Liparis tanakae]